MDNKLSELSKPSAEIVSKFGDPEAFGERELKVLADIQKLAYGTKFYSQEYVSALLAELEASSLQCRGIEQERELFRLERTAHQLHAQALEQRIAELERITEGVDQLAIDGGWTARGMSEYAKSLEAKLATPVRLPEGLAQKIKVTGYYEALNEMMDCVRAAGFKCVGDE